MPATIEKNVQAFDFNRSKRLSKEHQAGFEFATQSMSKMLTAYFTTLFRKLAEVKPVTVRGATYYDYIEAREDPTCLWTFEDIDSHNMGILEFQMAFTFLIVDRLFSGQGMQLGHVRPLTGIEQSILKRVIERTLQIWDQAWQPIHRVSTRTVGYENQSYLVQIASRNDPVIHLAFEVTFDGEKYNLELCLPYAYMDPFLLKMKDQSWMILLDEKSKKEDRDRIMPTVLKIKNPLFVSLGTANISIKDYIDLKVGNLVKLEQQVSQPLVAYIADKPCFWVRPGIKEDKKAIKIVQRYQEAEDEWKLEN